MELMTDTPVCYLELGLVALDGTAMVLRMREKVRRIVLSAVLLVYNMDGI